MRNQPVALDQSDAMRAYALRDRLDTVRETERVVTLTYWKRNGEESSSTGTVAYFNGREGTDTMSVTVNTEDKGPRTINIHKIIEIEGV